MAERQGFEPWKEVSPLTRLAGELTILKNISKITIYPLFKRL
jgi:hypothetical protein